MDPNANLQSQLSLAAKMIREYSDPSSNGIDQEDANSLAELVVALNDWIKRDGFLPDAWTKGRGNGPLINT